MLDEGEPAPADAEAEPAPVTTSVVWKRDWSGKGASDIIHFLQKHMAADRWYEFNATFPNGAFFLPSLALNKFVGMELSDLRTSFGGGGTHGWGRKCRLEQEGFFRAPKEMTLARRKRCGEEPVWILYSPGRLPPLKGPGQLRVVAPFIALYFPQSDVIKFIISPCLLCAACWFNRRGVAKLCRRAPR